MIQHIKAIYEGGVLRPLEPVALAEQEVVTLSIDAPTEAAGSEKHQPSLFDVLNAAGLIGCIENAPPDLSTNPQHLEGFGDSGK